MNSLVIRPFKPSDSVGTSELFRRVYGDHYVSPDVYVPHMICQHNLQRQWHSMVAVLNERVIGHAALCLHAKDVENAELALIAVDPALRGAQIASRLGQQLLGRCRDLRLARVSIKQVTSHCYSQRLAQRLGFHDTGLLPDYVPSPFAAALAETIVVGCQVIRGYHCPLPHLQWPVACQWLAEPLALRFGTTHEDTPASLQPLKISQLPGRIDIVAGRMDRSLAEQLRRLPDQWPLSLRLRLSRRFADDYRRLMAAGFIFTGMMPAERDLGWQALFHRGALARRLKLHSAPMQRLHGEVQAHAQNWKDTQPGSAA